MVFPKALTLQVATGCPCRSSVPPKCYVITLASRSPQPIELKDRRQSQLLGSGRALRSCWVYWGSKYLATSMSLCAYSGCNNVNFTGFKGAVHLLTFRAPETSYKGHQVVTNQTILKVRTFRANWVQINYSQLTLMVVITQSTLLNQVNIINSHPQWVSRDSEVTLSYE